MAGVTRRAGLLGLASLVAAPAIGPAWAQDWPDLLRPIPEAHPAVRAIVVVRGGRRVFERYRADTGPDDLLPVYSVTKSVTAALVGAAVGAGAFKSLDQPIGAFLPEAAEEGIDPRVRDITIRHLLTLTAGFDPDAPGGRSFGRSSLWRLSLRRPLAADPGTRFAYDNPACNLLPVLVARATGGSAETFARERLLGPLGIGHHAWPTDGEGHPLAAAGLRMTARDMARFGQLFLAGGRWEGRALVPEAFVRDATREHNEGGPPVPLASYGYLWWIARAPGEARAYFASGFGGQLVYVVPDRDLVVAMAADNVGTASRRFVNQDVLPALGLP